MRWACVLVLLLPVAARADEADDALALQLAAVLRDPRIELRERVEAAHTLTKLGPKAAAAVPQLQAQVQRSRGVELENLQLAVIETLGAIGAPARPVLPALARVSGRSIDIDLAQKKATDQILLADDFRDILALMRQLRSRDASLRLRATKAIGALQADGILALPALTVALEDEDGDVRRGAIAALRLIRPDTLPRKEIAKALQLDLKDDNDANRLAAVRALARLGDAAAPALPLLEGLLTDPDGEIRKAAAAAIARIGQQ